MPATVAPAPASEVQVPADVETLADAAVDATTVEVERKETEQYFDCPECCLGKSMKECYIQRFANDSLAVTDDTDAEGETKAKRPRRGVTPQEGDTFACIGCHRLRSRAMRVPSAGATHINSMSGRCYW